MQEPKRIVYIIRGWIQGFSKRVTFVKGGGGVSIHCLITKICGELGACFLYFSYVLVQNWGRLVTPFHPPWIRLCIRAAPSGTREKLVPPAIKFFPFSTWWGLYTWNFPTRDIDSSCSWAKDEFIPRRTHPTPKLCKQLPCTDLS